MIRIKAKRNGFRRAGMAHPDEWREYPDGKFDAKQIKALGDEPMLHVEIVRDEPQPAAEVFEADEQPAIDQTAMDKPAAARKGRKK